MATQPIGDSRACVIEDDLRVDTLAAILVNVCQKNPPLLRINPNVVGPLQVDRVQRWADALLADGCEIDILRATDL